MPGVVCCHAGVVHASVVRVEKVQDYVLDELDELTNGRVRGSLVVAKAATKLWLDAGHKGTQLIFTSSRVHDVLEPASVALIAMVFPLLLCSGANHSIHHASWLTRSRDVLVDDCSRCPP
jgi:hypothetical protein